MLRTTFICLLFVGSNQLLSQQNLEKFGFYIGLNQLQKSYKTNHRNPGVDRIFNKNLNQRRIRIGTRAQWNISNRFSYEGGAFLDNTFKSDNRHAIVTVDEKRYRFNTHNTISVGASNALVFRSYVSNKCVTYLKLSANTSFKLAEGQGFEEVNDITNQDQFSIEKLAFQEDFRAGGFDYFETSIDFSFGTYFKLPNENFQFLIEPRFSLWRHQKNSTLAIQPNESISDIENHIYGSLGLELSIVRKFEAARPFRRS